MGRNRHMLCGFVRAGIKTDFGDIVHYYVKSVYFAVDLAATMPLDLFSLLIADRITRWQFFAFLKLNRLIKNFYVSFESVE